MKKLLLVDDDPMNLKFLRFFLEAEGYECEVADDGQIAWQLLSKSDPTYDLIIADRIMPRMGALELLAEMKADPKYSEIPLIVLSGVAEREEIIDVIKAGAYDFLVKPLEKGLLLAVVRRALFD